MAGGAQSRLATGMSYRASLRGETFAFADLRELFAKANEEKSGDQLAGLAAGSELERVAAKLALADVTLGEIADTPVVDGRRHRADPIRSGPRSILRAAVRDRRRVARDGALDAASRASGRTGWHGR